jgi:hypothetical protein
MRFPSSCHLAEVQLDVGITLAEHAGGSYDELYVPPPSCQELSQLIEFQDTSVHVE